MEDQAVLKNYDRVNNNVAQNEKWKKNFKMGLLFQKYAKFWSVL